MMHSTLVQSTAFVLSIALLTGCGSKPPASLSQNTNQASPQEMQPNPDTTVREVLDSALPRLDNQLTTARLGWSR